MSTYEKRCKDGHHRATPRAMVVTDDDLWIQWLTAGGDGQAPALVTSHHRRGTTDTKSVCRSLLGEDRPSGTVDAEDLLGRVAVIEVSSYRVGSVSPDPQQGRADLSCDPLWGVCRPTESPEDALRWQPLDLPPSARARIEEAVRVRMLRPPAKEVTG